MIEPPRFLDDAPPSAPISARDILETAVALTAAALFGALIAIIEGWL